MSILTLYYLLEDSKHCCWKTGKGERNFFGDDSRWLSCLFGRKWEGFFLREIRLSVRNGFYWERRRPAGTDSL